MHFLDINDVSIIWINIYGYRGGMIFPIDETEQWAFEDLLHNLPCFAYIRKVESKQNQGGQHLLLAGIWVKNDAPKLLINI